MMNIVIVEDNPKLKEELRKFLELVPDFRIVGEAESGKDAIRLARKLQPDILITNLNKKDINGIEVTKRVKRLSPRTAVLIVSLDAHESVIHSALEAGASGYVLKDVITDHLVPAIRAAHKGKVYLSPPLSVSKIKEYEKRLEGKL